VRITLVDPLPDVPGAVVPEVEPTALPVVLMPASSPPPQPNKGSAQASATEAWRADLEKTFIAEPD